jgi:hypothetical protein
MASESTVAASRADSTPAAAGGQPSQASDTADLTAILSAHWRLGYRPSEKLLVAMGPFLCRRAAHLTQQQKHDLTQLLSDFEFDPGTCSFQMQVAALHIIHVAAHMLQSSCWMRCRLCRAANAVRDHAALTSAGPEVER